MNWWGKIALALGIGGGVATGVYFLRMKKAGASLESVAKIMVHKIGIDGLTLRTDLKLKNPSNTGLKLIYPFVRIVYEGATIGSSQSVNTEIELPAHGEAEVQQIMINVPMLKLVTTAASLFKTLSADKETKIDVNVQTNLLVGSQKIPYEKTETLPISKKEAAA